MAQQSSTGTGLMVQGRIVWTSGKLFEGAPKKDDKTKQLILDQQGKQIIQYGFGLAIPKTDPRTGQFTAEWTKLYQALYAEALTLFPSGHVPQGFAMKYKDGDVDVDPTGVPYNNREGYAGHVVLACTTYLPIKYFRFEGGNNIMVNDGFKCGDYVNAQLTIKAHPAIGQGKAGLYVNPTAVQFIQAGKEIINTPSGDQLFGLAAPTYAGEIVPHVAPTMPGMGTHQPGAAPMPGQQPGYAPQAPAMPPMGAPATQYAQPAAPQTQPHYGVLPQTHQPSAAPMPGQQPGYAPQAPAMPPMPGMPR